MEPEHKIKLKRLAADDIGGNENNVKFHFIIPFLESFGYHKFDFEHAAQGMRIDILIKTSKYKILIEAKSSDRNLDDYIPQLKRYCDEKRPILAIITNGEEIRFHSPFWRKADFDETLIYSIKRRQLSDDNTIEKIERVLGKQCLKDGSIVGHIEDREKEIDNIKEEIQCLSSTYQEKIEKLDTRISSLEEQLESIQSQIDANKAEVGDLRQEKRQKIQDLKKKHFIYFSQSKQATITTGMGLQQSGTNTKRRLGRKGYKQLPDYLIPVIRLIKNGRYHTDAFRQIAENLGVKHNTVSAECTRSLNITTQVFVELVKSNKIKSFLKERFPDKSNMIEQEL